MEITPSSTGKELKELATCIHELVGRLPLTIRSREKKGLRLEEGEILDYNYTGPVLEKVLKTGKTAREIPETGAYKGTPVIVVPLKERGEIIGAIGIVDITKGIFTDIREISRRPTPTNKGKEE